MSSSEVIVGRTYFLISLLNYYYMYYVSNDDKSFTRYTDLKEAAIVAEMYRGWIYMIQFPYKLVAVIHIPLNSWLDGKIAPYADYIIKNSF